MKNENTNEKPTNPSAFPFVVEYHRHSETNEGMTLRDYFASKAKDDFDDLDYDLKEIIVGRKCPDKVLKQKADPNIPFEFDAKWKFIQADALLKQRER